MKSVRTAKRLIVRKKSCCILIERGHFFTRLINTNNWHFDPGYVEWLCICWMTSTKWWPSGRGLKHNKHQALYKNLYTVQYCYTVCHIMKFQIILDITWTQKWKVHNKTLLNNSVWTTFCTVMKSSSLFTSI
jgi:hypothetical protein